MVITQITTCENQNSSLHFIIIVYYATRQPCHNVFNHLLVLVACTSLRTF